MQMGTLPLRELSDLSSIIQAEIQSIAQGLLEFSLGLLALSSLAPLTIYPLGYRTGANALCFNFTGEHVSLSPQRYLWAPWSLVPQTSIASYRQK